MSLFSGKYTAQTPAKVELSIFQATCNGPPLGHKLPLTEYVVVKGFGVLLRSIVSASLVFALAALTAAQTAAQGAGRSTPSAESIVSRMMAVWQGNQARNRAYTVKRDYQLLDLYKNKQEQPRAQVIASITYLPPDLKQYNIEGGSGGKVLRDIVQKETESAKEAQRKELSPLNYDFQVVGQELVDGRDCYVLSLIPKREDKNLLRGKVWVDAVDYRIHRLEGNPVKSPSWWIRDLHIRMSFASVDGMWLHTFTYAVADVRFKGQYVVQSRDLEYRSAVQTARKHRRNPGILAGAAINP